MNIKKPVDYLAMYKELDALLMSELPQMELYCKIGKLVSSRPEKGAAVAALNTSSKPILMSPASPPGTFAGCGIFIEPIRMPRRCWPRP